MYIYIYIYIYYRYSIYIDRKIIDIEATNKNPDYKIQITLKKNFSL